VSAPFKGGKEFSAPGSILHIHALEIFALFEGCKEFSAPAVFYTFRLLRSLPPLKGAKSSLHQQYFTHPGS
jgi:hypothetical protein